MAKKKAAKKPEEIKAKVSTVGELLEVLGKADPKAPLSMRVGWAKDTAYMDDGEPITVTVVESGVVDLYGWMSDCGAQLY